MAYDILANASETLASNSTTWITREEVEHFLGDADVLHAGALVLGIVAIMFARRLPAMLAVVASVSLALWVGLVVQDRQAFDQPVAGIDLPEGAWVPILCAMLSAVAAAALVLVAWRAALALLTAGIMMFLSVAVCRLANVSPQRIVKAGGAVLSSYRIVGAVTLVLVLLACAFLVRRFHAAMVTFTSAHLGTLLFLSGVSHFIKRAGQVEAPFSLLDDLARVFAEVRSDRCQVWDKGDGKDQGLKGCDCSDECRTEITAWIVSSLAVLAGHAFMKHRERRYKKLKAREDEKVPLASQKGLASQAGSSSLPPEAIGKAQV